MANIIGLPLYVNGHDTDFVSHTFQVHPVPAFDNAEAFNKMLDHMQDVGLYLMYDMRLYVFRHL
jgi:hypothetical protein